MVGAHFLISSPEDSPTTPLIPPPRSWTMTMTSTTTYSLSAASPAEFFAQFLLLHAATASQMQTTKSEPEQQIKSYVPQARCSTATRDSVENSADTIKDKAATLFKSS